MKVAYLALTYKTFQQHDVMRQFFNTEHHDRFNLYIHNKEPLDQDDHFVSYCLPEHEIIKDTEWGKHSLVEATIALLKRALSDPENKIFVLISDSHLPLYNIITVSDILLKECDITSFGLIDQKDARHRFFKMFKSRNEPFDNPFDISNMLSVSQWFVCTRDAAAAYIEATEKYDHLIDKDILSYTDEFWFALLSKHLDIPHQTKTFTFSNWSWESPQSMILKGCKRHPHTFEKVSRVFIDKQRKLGRVFIRKVHSDTQIDTTYLFL